jgi:hypothetical protein
MAGKGRAVASSFADILGDAGFSDAAALAEAVGAWDATLAGIRPAAVVCEHSPFLCLATHGGELPTLVLGYGFVLPPPELARFPRLADAESGHSEEALLENVRAVMSARRRLAPAALPAIFSGDAHFVTGLDALDPYRAIRRRRAIGPPGVRAHRGRRATGDHVFAYLLGDAPVSRVLLSALGRSGLRGRVFVRRGTAEQRQAIEGTGLTWLDQPADMDDVLAHARLIVHHGSMLTSEEALLAGCPQLVVPLYLEHLFTAAALRSLGVGTVLVSSASAAEAETAITQRYRDGSAAQAAEAFAHAPRAAVDPAALLETVLPRL